MKATYEFGPALTVEVAHDPRSLWTVTVRAMLALHCPFGQVHQIPLTVHRQITVLEAHNDKFLLDAYEGAIRGDRARANELADLLIGRAIADGVHDPCREDSP